MTIADTVNELLHGSIDMHIHFGPDPEVSRSVDAVQAATEARDAGMRAIVLKSADYPTAPLAYVLNRLIPGIEVFGALSLNYAVGGVNIAAVQSSAKLGAKVVWLPTLSAANDRRTKGLSDGLTVLDPNGSLIPEVREILEIVQKHDMVLGTGHISAEEVFAVVAEAQAMKVPKVVVTHPEGKNVALLSVEQMSQLADMGAYIEHCFQATMPGAYRLDPREIVRQIKGVRAERTILSTDLGQIHNPKPAEGMRVMIATFLKLGLSQEELDIMVKKNPAKLLGLD